MSPAFTRVRRLTVRDGSRTFTLSRTGPVAACGPFRRGMNCARRVANSCLCGSADGPRQGQSNTAAGVSHLYSATPKLRPFTGRPSGGIIKMMRKLFIGTVTLLTVGAILAGSATAQESPASGSQPAPTAKTQQAPAAGQNPRVQALTTQKDKVSYAVGLSIGKNLQRDSVEIDPNIVLQGLTDGLTGGKVLLTDDEVKATLTTLQSEVRQRQQAKMQEAAATNKKEGAAFLAANKTKQGVVTLPSGLQYKILKEANGPKPTASDS